jgi:hypothetical protein
MKVSPKPALLIALFALSTTSAHAGAYNFGGNCPSQGAWTQQALQQTGIIKDAIRKLKDNPACKGLETVITDLQAAATELEIPKGEENQETRLESLPTEMNALQKTLTDGNSVNSDASTMLLNRTIEAATISSDISSSTSLGAVTNGLANSSTAVKTGGLSLLYKKLKAPTMKGLELATKVMQILPQYDECLIGQPSQGLAIIAGSVKVAAAMSASGEGVGDKLGNAIASLMNMLRERKFTLALRELDETEFWFSMSCLIESSTKNYCDAQDAQEIMKYSQDQYKASMNKIKTADRTAPTYDNPLEGYYLLVRELPKISSWLQKVQFGVSPKLAADANFKNKIWEQVTDLTKSVNSLTGFFNEQMLFMRELTDVEAKRNQLFEVIHAISGKMSGGAEGGGADGTQFFSTTVNGSLLPFYLIGRDIIPEACRPTELRPMGQDWEMWMKTSGANGGFIADFADPDKLAIVVESRMNEIIAAASAKSSAYFRQRLVVDMPNLVAQTLTSQYMTIRKAFENVYNYLVRFENKLNKDDMDVILIPNVRQTKIKIQKFLKSYDALHQLGKEMANTKSSMDDVTLDPKVNEAAKQVIDTVYNEFNVLFQKDTYLTNRLTTFIEKDFAMRVRAGTNMTPYQKDLMVINQENLLQKLTEVHGLNPTKAQQDLAAAQMINKRNIESIEEVFSDSLYRMIANVKAVVDGKGDAGFQATIDARLAKEKRALMKVSTNFRLPFDPGVQAGMFLSSWLFGKTIIKNANPDLYQAPKNAKHIMGIDDKFGSFARMQAMFCAQTLSFERRSVFYDICKNTSLKSFYVDKPELNLDYNKYLPDNMFTPIKIRQSPELTGKNICAMNEFSIRNIVQWLKDQDQEMYGDNMIE